MLSEEGAVGPDQELSRRNAFPTTANSEGALLRANDRFLQQSRSDLTTSGDTTIAITADQVTKVHVLKDNGGTLTICKQCCRANDDLMIITLKSRWRKDVA